MYCRWVRDNLPTEELADGRYITRSNIDAYYSRFVVHCNGMMPTITRIAPALKWFYTNVEEPGGPDFILKNTHVKECISIQQDNYKSGANDRHAGVDPHKGLKDLMPQEDLRKIVSHMHQCRHGWGSLAMSFTWGTQTGVRGASTRKFTLCDLNMSRGFVPVRTGPRSRTLMLVLRKGDTHKDNYTTDKQEHPAFFRCWRHSKGIRDRLRHRETKVR